MVCRDARQILAGEIEAARAARAEARAHVTTCAACQARADQFAAAILSEAEEEISCAECLARIDAHVAGALAGDGEGDAAEADPLTALHLASCPECDEAHRLLQDALSQLADGSLPIPGAFPSFDLDFASGAKAGEPERRPLFGRFLRWLESWRQAWQTPAWQRASRGTLAGLALVIVAGFAWLLIFDPSLPEPIRSLSPFGLPRPTLTEAEVSATQTMAVQMGIDWVDSAGDLAPGTVTATAPAGSRPPRLPSASPGADRGTASPGSADREREKERDRDPRRAAEPTALDPRLMITGTLVPGGNIAYPPPATATEDPYPPPDDPDATAEPTPGEVEPGRPTETPRAPRPTRVPEPSQAAYP